MRVDVHSTMEDLPGLLARDYGFKSQARSASMSASRGVLGANATSAGSARSARSSSSAAPSDRARSAWDPSLSVDSLLGDHGPGFFGNRSSHDRSGGIGAFDEFYTKPSSNGRPPSSSSSPPSSSSFGYDDILGGFKDPATKASSGPPVYDKPVYDEDMFDGLPGVKSSSAGLYEDVFATSAPKSAPPSYDDLLDNLGRKEPELKSSVPEDMSVFDDLIPGFGGVSAPQQRGISKTDHAQSSVPSSKSTSSIDDPFVVLESSPAPAHSSSGLFTDPIEHIKVQSGGMKFDDSSVGDRGVFDNIDVFDGFPKSDPIFSSEMRNNQEGPSSQKNTSSGHPAAMAEEPSERSSVKKTFENDVPKTVPVDGYQDSHETVYEMPTNFTESVKSFNGGGASTRDVNALKETKFSMEEMSPESQEHFEMADDAWLTVSEVPLFTEPTSAPPPSRQPPPLVIKHASFANTDRGSSVGLNAKPKVNESYSFSQFNQSNQFSKPVNDSLKTAGVSPVDELDDFARGRPQAHADTYAEGLPSEEELETNSTAAASAAAMKEAMDRAELKFKHARGVRERERDSRSTKNREFTPDDRDEKAIPDAYGLQHKEKHDLEREQWDREEKEKEQKRLEKERERELQREREKAREAVERATREARERAAAEARRKAERSAVEKATTEARERAERAAFQRAATEARERASSEARERAERERTERERVEREAVEARERAAAEAREKATAATRNRAAAERAAVERAAAEARLRAERAAVDRANAEARGRAATAAREKQQKNENDMGSFAGKGAPPNSAPRQRPTNMDTAFDPKTQNKGGSDGASRPPSHSTPGIRKPSPTMNIVDDLTSIFGSAPSSGEFQEIDGESEERRRARLERHQRTMGRAAKALADKNERDMQTQREQAERHRIGETLDVEIKRWSAGKEGNLRALLSTLQYILWPECGWQPVSLTDLITAASVKKVYRKATLCIHPDKVQQKGANLQQKYISEKVFDLLKEAWNKLNSEELF